MDVGVSSSADSFHIQFRKVKVPVWVLVCVRVCLLLFSWGDALSEFFTRQVASCGTKRKISRGWSDAKIYKLQ